MLPSARNVIAFSAAMETVIHVRAANYCRTLDNVRPNLANVRTKPNFDQTKYNILSDQEEILLLGK